MNLIFIYKVYFYYGVLMSSIKDEIIRLQSILNYHDYLYHTLDSPIISDKEYDYLMLKLHRLEKKFKNLCLCNSPTKKVGSLLLTNFPSVKHFVPMLSLDNTFTKNGFLNFYKKVKRRYLYEKKIIFCCELKFDGIAINALYKDGCLVQIQTRGNGYFGENVTNNIHMIDSLPDRLNTDYYPKKLEVRGEVVMLRSDFIKLNNIANFNKTKIFSNPRNAAAGSLRNCDPKLKYKRKLMFFCYGYGLLEDDILNINSHYYRLKKLESWGFFVHQSIFLTSDLNKIINFYNQVQKNRLSFDFDIDGIVVKVDSIEEQKIIGFTTNSPRWAIAFKFINEEEETEILDVIFQIGRTGIITPVAILKPVQISGVIIRKASLYNINEIKKLGLNIGDKVIVCRSGDVIPKIVRVTGSNYFKKRKLISFPNICPVCRSKLCFIKNKGILYCIAGLSCKAQLKKTLNHFFSKEALNVQGLGENIINQLVDLDYIHSAVDVYNLNIKKLSNLKGINNKLAANIIYSLNKSRTVSLSHFINALGIHNLGKITSENIANHFHSLEKIMCADISDLQSVFNIGKITASNIFFFMKDIKNRMLIFQLNKELNIFYKSLKLVKNNFLFSKIIVITGTLDNFSRSEIKEKLIKFGAVTSNTISKKTNFLICGKKPGVKLNLAKKLNILILDEKKILELFSKEHFD